MPARAHFATYALDSEGRPIAGCTVTVREPDTETLISETIFAEDDPDITEKSNPFTADADGKVEIWLESPKVVDLYVTKTGFDPSTIRATAHQLTASTLTLKEDGTPLAQRAGVNFLSGFDLTDDAGNDETEIAIDLTEVTTFTDHSARHEDGGADEINLAGLSGEPAALSSHLGDATDAHDASAISVLDAGALLAATNVEAALAEIQGNVDTDEAALAAHLADGTDAHDASAISILDAATQYAATNVEDALAEVLDAHQAHLADASDAHDASAISILDAGGDFAATTVEGALDELQADHETDAANLTTHEATVVHDFQHVVKSVDEQVTASTTLQDDNELLFAVGANEDWEFEFVIGYRSTTTADFKFDLSMPTGGAASGEIRRLGVGASALTAPFFEFVQDFGADISSGGIGTTVVDIVPIVIRGVYIGGANAGNVTFRWAQNNSEGTNTTVEDGSYVVARRLA